MNPISLLTLPSAALLAVALAAAPARADESFAKTIDDVNSKMVKIFGAGGFKGLASYGSGVVVSSDGYILTVNSLMLTSADVRVHLSDGRRFHAQLVLQEPELDVALLKIKEKIEDLPYFDIAELVKKPVAETGTRVLGFSNQFNIATRGEKMTVQQGWVAAYAKLPLRRGVFEAPYVGEVYVVDAIISNPGALGGALTNRKGELLGLVGKEFRNSLTDTWINYALPIQAKIEGQRKGEKVTVSIAEIVEKREKYVPIDKPEKKGGPGGFHGIILVANPVDRTPPYIEEVMSGSPAAKAGLKPDDLIVYVDGEAVGSINVFKEIMALTATGQEVKLEVRRGERLESVVMKLGEYPGGKPAAKK